MDPMESMSLSGGNVPAGFNAEDAGNMEDVGAQKISGEGHDVTAASLRRSPLVRKCAILLT